MFALQCGSFRGGPLKIARKLEGAETLAPGPPALPVGREQRVGWALGAHGRQIG
jgi:hypothetical protein